MGFTNDLARGEEIEREILAILKKKYPRIQKETGRYCREFYDFIIPQEKGTPEIKLEIKSDFYTSSNFAFECLGRTGKSTGIIKTSAKYWVHYRKDNYYIWEVPKLKRYLLNVGGKLRNCGDDKASAAWIIDEKEVLEKCPPNAVVPRGSEKLCEAIV